MWLSYSPYFARIKGKQYTPSDKGRKEVMYVAFIDLDDTLLDNNKQISDFTYKILVEFQEQGNILVLTTARSKQLHGLQERLKTITPYFIYHNGGEIYSQGVLLYQKFLTVLQQKE